MTIALRNTGNITKGSLLFNAVVAGLKGAGKTTFCSSFPDPLFWDFDDGIVSLLGANVNYVPSRFLSYENMLEMGMAITRRTPEGNVSLRLEAEDGSIAEQEVKVGTVVIDSLTRGHRTFLKSAMELGSRKMPAIQDWGLAADRIIQLIDLMKPYVHVLVVCHFEIVKDGNLERVMAQLRLPGQLVDLIPICCDELWRIRTEIGPGRKRQVTMWTVDDGIFPGATRHGRRGMPPFIDITDDPPGTVDPFKRIMLSIR